jgi:hypothetical protein
MVGCCTKARREIVRHRILKRPSPMKQSVLTLSGIRFRSIGILRWTPLLLGTLVAAAADTGIQRIYSGPAQVPLLELFTSEGCSSCPPAEKWLSSLTHSEALWKNVVPVSFHVDYWDNLGWKDGFAASDHVDRQQDYAALWKSRNIYTPEFVLGGAEWRAWGGAQDFQKHANPTAGILTVDRQTNDTFTIHFRPGAGDPNNIEATVAWLGVGISSKVRRGENAGKTLDHNFVLLTRNSHRMVPSGGVLQTRFQLEHPRLTPPARLAFAVWVSREGNPTPLQAAGAWMTGAVPGTDSTVSEAVK